MEIIKKVQEFILHKEPSLAKTYLNNVLDFSVDPIQDARKAVIAFIEELWYVNGESFAITDFFNLQVKENMISYLEIYYFSFIL